MPKYQAMDIFGVCVCVRVVGREGIHARGVESMYAYAYKGHTQPQVSFFWCHLPYFCYCFNFVKGRVWNLNLAVRLDWLTREPQGPAYSHLPQ